MIYACQAQLQRAETDVLAVYCSDHRIQAGVREFLDDHLGLRANYDSLVVPGGPQCLVEVDTLPKFAWASRKWSRALIGLHSLKRMILIAHHDCGWYRWLADYQPPRSPVRRGQEEDLRAALRALSQLNPDLSVELFYAGWDSSGAMTIESVTS